MTKQFAINDKIEYQTTPDDIITSLTRRPLAPLRPGIPFFPGSPFDPCRPGTPGNPGLPISPWQIAKKFTQAMVGNEKLLKFVNSRHSNSFPLLQQKRTKFSHPVFESLRHLGFGNYQTCLSW